MFGFKPPICDLEMFLQPQAAKVKKNTVTLKFTALASESEKNTVTLKFTVSPRESEKTL